MCTSTPILYSAYTYIIADARTSYASLLDESIQFYERKPKVIALTLIARVYRAIEYNNFHTRETISLKNFFTLFEIKTSTLDIPYTEYYVRTSRYSRSNTVPDETHLSVVPISLRKTNTSDKRSWSDDQYFGYENYDRQCTQYIDEQVLRNVYVSHGIY